MSQELWVRDHNGDPKPLTLDADGNLPVVGVSPARLSDLVVDVALTGVAQGDLLYRGASKWNNLGHGTTGQFLKTPGAAADPLWASLGLTDLSVDVTLAGVARGDILFRGASKWNNLAHGTNGQFLKTGGVGADPAWATLGLADLTADLLLTSVAQGDLLYRDASGWKNLATGTAGQMLQAAGAGANPAWATPFRRAVAVTAGFAALQAAALTADASVLTVPAKTRVAAVYADLTTPFTGGAVSAATLQLGKTTGGAEYLVAFDALTAPVQRGTADAHLGTSLNRTSAVQGADLPSWTAPTTLSLRLTTVDANTDATTAGSVRLIVILETLP
jgi:hypothetical protein